MASKEKLEETWRQMVMVDAEYELAEKGLNMEVEEYGLSSAEAMEVAQRLDRIGARLLRLDEAYARLLDEGTQGGSNKFVNIH